MDATRQRRPFLRIGARAASPVGATGAGGGWAPPPGSAASAPDTEAPRRPNGPNGPNRPNRRVVAVATAVLSLVLLSLVLQRAGDPASGVSVQRSDRTGLPPDVTFPPDLTFPPDGSLPPDVTVPPDLNVPPDLTVPPDVTFPPDVTVPPDATVPPNPDDPDLALVDPNVFVELLPQLRSMPAPGWVRTGTRLSYYAAVASVPGSYHEYVEDENGGWVDPTTGDRYDQIDIPGTGGHGYNQVTVTALTPSVAALSVRAYGLTELTLDDDVSTLTWGGVVGLPGAGSDYWLHPDVLAQVDEVVTSSLKVLRMPYSIDGTTFDSLWVQSIGETSNLTWVYDLETGVLLHTASSTVGPPLTGPVAEGEGRDGSTFLSQSTLVAVRDTALPWADDPPPDWLSQVARLEYAGSVVVGSTSAPTATIDAWLTVDRVSSGSEWARYVFSRTLSTDVTPSVTESLERIDGPAQVGGVWLPPTGLAGLVAGEVVDEDPLTGTVTTVTDADGTFVTIVESGRRETSVLVYEVASGLLVQSSTTDQRLGTTTMFEFVGWS